MKQPLIGVAMAVIMSAACAPSDQAPSSLDNGASKLENPLLESFSFVDQYDLLQLKDSFTQPVYQANEISVYFDVRNALGQPTSNLGMTDFQLHENGIQVTNANIMKVDVDPGTKLDLVFVVDQTAGMSEMVNSLKSQVPKMVQFLTARHIQANLCLVTFTDSTQKLCQSFVEDNPGTEANENLQRFLSDLQSLQIGGGGDEQENQLRALIDAASRTPWQSAAQRVAILVTDSWFHYSPFGQGHAGNNAPTYDQAINAVVGAKMSVFAIAPSNNGYDGPFDGKPALPLLVGGSFYNYTDIDSGVLKLETVLTAIADDLSSRSVVRYAIENNPQLDPNLKLSDRTISLVLKDPNKGRLKVLNTASTLPLGRPDYQKSWYLSKPAKPGSANTKVYLNGVLQTAGYSLSRHQLSFSETPLPGTKVEVQYDTESLSDGLGLRTYVLPAGLDLDSMVIRFNNIPVEVWEVRLTMNLEGQYILEPGLLLSGTVDRFSIASQRGLKLEITGIAAK